MPAQRLRSDRRTFAEPRSRWLSGFTSSRVRFAATLALAAMLAGCGGSGGGSDGGSSNPSAPVSSNPSAPVITAQPQNATVNVGGNAAFSVSASGSGLSYQWLRGGKAIAGASGSSYALNAVSASDDQAQLSVTVSNTGGQVTSSVAVLTVLSPPSITAQPQNTTVSPGDTATFSVTASASHGTLSYQWYKGSTALADGGHVSGSRTGVLTLTQVALSDAGGYSVTVSDPAGSV